MTTRIFPNSAGWNVSGPICAHSLAPLVANPIPGTTGNNRRIRPSSPIVYV